MGQCLLHCPTWAQTDNTNFDADMMLSMMEVLFFFKDFILGGVAGLIAKTLAAPLERIKLLLQIQDGSAQMLTAKKRYEGIADCAYNVYKEQGLLSFWRGNWANILRYFPTQAINFAMKDLFKKLILKDVDRAKHFWTYCAGSIASGSAAGATSLTLLYPLDFARTRLGADIGETKDKREYTGVWDCIKKVFRSDGLCGLYRGFWISLFGIIVYRGAYFGFYDTSKELISSDYHNVIIKFMVSLVTTNIAGLISYPFDMVRRRMMMQSGLQSEDLIYKNSLHCAITIIREESVFGLYKGALTNAFRSICSALVLVIYEELKAYFETFEQV